MDNRKAEADDALANLRHMIAEAKAMNAKSQDSAKGTKMLTRIVNHETLRSRRKHDKPEPPKESESDELQSV